MKISCMQSYFSAPFESVDVTVATYLDLFMYLLALLLEVFSISEYCLSCNRHVTGVPLDLSQCVFLGGLE